MRATGATGAQVFFRGVWPAVLPQFTSQTLYVWEFNLRDSTVLGLVGAGGPGLLLSEAMSLFQWGRQATLLRELAFSVLPGERVALAGHNGAGKSSLLRALTGFSRVHQGHLRVLDTEMSGAPAAAPLRRLHARAAQVQQGLPLVGRLSALDNVLIGGAGRHASLWTWLCR